jgi:DNA mismatch endonuclease (patch repair protein)
VDIVFAKPRVAVFVDGCFWHGCPEHGQRAHDINGWYWRDKISGNRERDADTDSRLQTAGWTVVRVWEHEEPSEIAEAIWRRVEAFAGSNARQVQSRRS